MVIVAAIALSTMVSNHIVLPVWLNAQQGGAALSGACLGVPLQQRLVGARHQAAFPQVVFPLVVVAV